MKKKQKTEAIYLSVMGVGGICVSVARHLVFVYGSEGPARIIGKGLYGLCRAILMSIQ
jgi:hypothetical protein